jgi:hypothetical protein
MWTHRLGDPIDPEKALMEITDLSEVYAVARVPEHQAGRMKPGTVAHIKVAALPNEKFEGELLRFGTSRQGERHDRRDLPPAESRRPAPRRHAGGVLHRHEQAQQCGQRAACCLQGEAATALSM